MGLSGSQARTPFGIQLLALCYKAGQSESSYQYLSQDHKGDMNFWFMGHVWLQDGHFYVLP